MINIDTEALSEKLTDIYLFQHQNNERLASSLDEKKVNSKIDAILNESLIFNPNDL